MIDRSYSAGVEFTTEPHTIACSCSDCEWTGTADQLAEIGDAVLTPGDPSPAGRCPDCAALAYVDDDRESRLLDALAKVYNCLLNWVEIAEDHDKRQEDDEALKEAAVILRANGRMES